MLPTGVWPTTQACTLTMDQTGLQDGTQSTEPHQPGLSDTVFQLEPSVVKFGSLLDICIVLFTEYTWAFQDALRDLNELATDLLSSGTFNADQIVKKRDNINKRFLDVQNLAALHHEKLKEAYALFQFFQDLDDEESWIEYVLPTHIALIIQKSR